MQQPLGWFGIFRLGLVQTALGAIVVLTTSTLNRVMIVELALAASLPAALVGWHYAIQLSRPLWGHRSDVGQKRTPFIIGGMGVLALGALLATNATLTMADAPAAGIGLAILAFTLIGLGVGASGTSLLALLATAVSPQRRPAAASITWIMMIFGIVLTAGLAGAVLDPFSGQRLALVASGIAGCAFLLTLVAVRGIEARHGNAISETSADQPQPGFKAVLRDTWQDSLARAFTIFVFMSMLAYSAQDLILEPFAGIVFDYSVGKSTQLTGTQHSGVLLGMILVGLGGTLIKGDRTVWLKRLTILGCLASALMLCLLAIGGSAAETWPLTPTVFGLGFGNGVFAVSAIGLMMSYAGGGEGSREGIRMGVWGAAQASAFGIGGFLGAAGLDVMRALLASEAVAFGSVFVAEATLFVAAAVLALRLGRPDTPAQPAIARTPDIKIGMEA